VAAFDGLMEELMGQHFQLPRAASALRPSWASTGPGLVPPIWVGYSLEHTPADARRHVSPAVPYEHIGLGQDSLILGVVFRSSHQAEAMAIRSATLGTSSEDGRLVPRFLQCGWNLHLAE